MNNIVVCCNGALPYVDLHLWPHEQSKFRTLDITDWIATDQTLVDFLLSNSTLNDEDTHKLPDWLMHRPLENKYDYCDLYNLTFTSDNLQKMYSERNGSLACDCPSFAMGAACEILAEKLSTTVTEFNTNSWSTSMYLLLILLPVCFIIFAVAGAWLCRCCLLDMPLCCSWCRRKSPSQSDDLTRPLDGQELNDLIERAERYKQKDDVYNSTTVNPTEVEQFLPSVSGQRVPDYYNPSHNPGQHEPSPPPSYKSQTSSPNQERRFQYPPQPLVNQGTNPPV